MRHWVSLSVLTLFILVSGCHSAQQAESTPLPHYISDQDLLKQVYEASTAKSQQDIIPIPDTLPIDPEQAKLGKMLFFDPRLSADNTVSCASCHQFRYAGADNKPVSIGIHGQKGDLNAPPVFNAVFNLSQFWDGRAHDLQQQAEGPLLNPKEQGMPDWSTLIKKLKAIPHYQNQFKQIFPNHGITKATITYAIAQYERTLLTPNSPFDRYLKGDKDALSAEAKQGYHLFQQLGCIACHNGINIGGNLYQKAGVFEELSQKQGHEELWLGRYNVTHHPEDKGYFKIPSLRNIALTAPYLHDGSIQTLDEMIKTMIQKQLGLHASEKEVQQLKAFLNSLTGEYQGKPLNQW